MKRIQRLIREVVEVYDLINADIPRVEKVLHEASEGTLQAMSSAMVQTTVANMLHLSA